MSMLRRMIIFISAFHGRFTNNRNVVSHHNQPAVGSFARQGYVRELTSAARQRLWVVIISLEVYLILYTGCVSRHGQTSRVGG